MLRILFAEVSNNEAYLEFIGSFRRGDKPISLVGKGADKHLDVEAWKETRVKLAQHLSSEKFATLAGYYSDLLWLRQQLGEEDPSAKQLPFKIDMTPGMARELHKKADKVKAII